MGVLLMLRELAVYTRFPLQMVLSTPAVTVQPSKGVERPWEKKKGCCRWHGASSDPARSDPRSLPPRSFRRAGGTAAGGLTHRAFSSVAKGTMPGSTSSVYSTGKAHSNPTMPLRLRSPLDFSSALWGAWSVAMQSMVPSSSPFDQSIPVRGGADGGFILNRPSSIRSSSQRIR